MIDSMQKKVKYTGRKYRDCFYSRASMEQGKPLYIDSQEDLRDDKKAVKTQKV